MSNKFFVPLHFATTLSGPLPLCTAHLQKVPMIKRVLIVVAVVSLFSPVSKASTILFDNLNGSAITSATPNDLQFAETVDDVTFATTTVVTGINWSGLYEALAGGDDFVSAADDDFVVNIYSDNAGTPGPLLQSFSLGNAVNRTPGATVPFSGPLIQSFDYSANINFTFNAGVTHWLSILNNTPGDTDVFFQSTGTGGNTFGRITGEGFTDQAQGGEGFATNFQLTFTAIPEPSSVGILALSLMGLLTRRRRC